LLEFLDRAIFGPAKARDFVVVSADSDFYDLATIGGAPAEDDMAAALRRQAAIRVRVRPARHCALRQRL